MTRFAAELALHGLKTLHAEQYGRVVLSSRWNVEADGRCWLHEEDEAKAGKKPTPEELAALAECRRTFDPEARSPEESLEEATRALLAERRAILDALLGDPRALRAAARRHGYPIPEAP